MRHREAIVSTLAVCMGLVGALVILFPTGAPTKAVNTRQDQTQEEQNPTVLSVRREIKTLAGTRPTPDTETSTADAPVEGVVVDSVSGAPVPNAWVFSTSSQLPVVSKARAVRTDEQGRFKVSMLVRDDAVVNVVAESHVPASVDLRGRTRPLRIALDAGGQITGRVVDDAGRAVGGVRVWCRRAGSRVAWPNPIRPLWFSGGGGSGGAQGLSGEDGLFVLRGLPPDTQFDVLVASATHAAPIDSPQTSEVGDELEFVLRAQYGATLLFVDEDDGRPIRFVRYGVHTPRGMLAIPRVVSELAAWHSRGGAQPVARAVADTYRYVWDSGPPSDAAGPAACRVVAAALGYEPSSVLVELAKGMPKLRKIRMRRAFDGDLRAVRIYATFAGGKGWDGPLAIRVGNEETGSHRCELIFKRGRSVEAVRVPPGTYGVVAAGSSHQPDAGWWNPAGPPTKLDVAGPGREIECRLNLRGVGYQLRVHDAAGGVLRGYGLTATPERGRVTGGRFDWDLHNILNTPSPEDATDPGARSMLWLPPGPCLLRVYLPGMGSAEARVDCGDDGSVQNLDLHLRIPTSSK